MIISTYPPAPIFYAIEINADLDAIVMNGDGNTYHVSGLTCTCPDFTRRGGSYDIRGISVCKHVYWVLPLTPCRKCGSTSYHDRDRKRYVCTTCLYSIPEKAVHDRRRPAWEDRRD
jgi:ribosomal protein L37E